MTLYLWVVFLVGVVHANLDPEGACPLIHAKPESECVGTYSECWSPNTYDVDCENGAQVCCFDGCANVCGKPPVCRIVPEPHLKTIVDEVCLPEEQSRVCTTKTFEECWDDCKTIEDTVQSVIEVDFCKNEIEPFCQTVSEKVCSSTTSSVQSCPVIPLKSAVECANQLPSECWSPGEADVDCPSNGLCCFNGCSNRCYDNCVEEKIEVCNDYTVEECNDVPSQNCGDVPSPISVPMKTTTCTKMESACMSMPRTFCSGFNFADCRTEVVEKCSEAGQEDCSTSTTFVDKEVTFNKCEITHKNVCYKVPKRDCHTETKTVCSECRIVESERCHDVPKTVCKKVPQTVDKVVPRNVCEKVCKPRDEETCIQPEPKTVCKPVTKTVKVQVPVRKCF